MEQALRCIGNCQDSIEGQGVCYEAISNVLEAEMPSAAGVERSHKRRSRRRSHRRGSLMQAHPLAQELVLIVGGPLIFVLMFALFGPGWAILSSVVAIVVFGARGIDTASRTWQHKAEPDFDKQFRWFGRLVLLFAVFSALAYSVPGEKYQEWAALAENPKPTDCDWSTLPMGEKACHYEPIFHHVNESGRRMTVEWRRVNE